MKIDMYNYTPHHFTEKSFTLVVYRIESGRVISVSPMSKRLNIGKSLYALLDSNDADKLRNINRSFSRLPMLCVLGGKTVIAARSLQGRFDIGVLFVFETSVDAFLSLAESGRLDLVVIDREISDRKRENVDEDEQERVSDAYRLMLNSLYNIDAEENISDTIAFLAELAGCCAHVSKEVCETIGKMDREMKSNLQALLFMTFLFVAREGAKRDVNMTVAVRRDEPIIIFTSELYSSKAPRADEELCEFMRIADEQGLLYEAMQNESESAESEMRIELDPKTLDVSMLGIKIRPKLEDI